MVGKVHLWYKHVCVCVFSMCHVCLHPSTFMHVYVHVEKKDSAILIGTHGRPGSNITVRSVVFWINC